MAERNEPSIPRSKPNYLYAIISVALVLFLLGFFGMLAIQANSLVQYYKEQINIMVELKANATPVVIDSLKTSLQTAAYVKDQAVRFISKEEALELLREDFGEDFMKLDLPNPLYDVLVFNVHAAYMHSDSLKTLRETLRSSPYISDVYYQESLVDVLMQNIQRIGWIALGVGVFFSFIAFVLIHNTIRLALYANRFLIKNMQLVGASWEFISRPYLLRSIWHGLLSGLLAIGILLGLLFLAERQLPGLKEVQDLLSLGVLFGSLLLFGILISTVSTFYVVNRYLKMRVDDLY